MKHRKIGLLIVSLIFAIGSVTGGTLAWLKATDEAVVNQFTPSHIDVELEETKDDFKMIPGWSIEKDPKVSVSADSEDCYLFVQITESENLDQYIKYAIDDKWATVPGITDVYYIAFDSKSTAENKPVKGGKYSILGAGTYTFTNNTEDTTDDIEFSWNADEVLTLPEVTEGMMETADASKPTLTFKAYAVQLYKNQTEKFDVAVAWALAQTNQTNN